MTEQPTKRNETLQQASVRERKQLKRLSRRLAMIGLLLMFSLLLTAIWLPVIAEWALQRSFSEGLQARGAAADVKSSPAWNLLRGKTDSMSLWLEFDNNSLISMNMLRANWGPSNVALSLIRQGQGSNRDAEPNETELYWDENRLAAYLNRVQGEVLVSRVEIAPAAVSIYGSIAIAGGKHNIYISGLPHANDLGQVVFPAESCRVEGLILTPQLQENIVDALSFEPNLAPLQWKVWAKQVKLEQGRMIVYGSSSCCR